MSNRIKFYPFISKTDPLGIRFIPYDQTEFELITVDDTFSPTKVFNQLKANTEGYVPVYNPDKTYTEQLQDLHTKLGYWPAPISHKDVYEDIPVIYDDNDDGWTKENSSPTWKHHWERYDDKVPF
jgi:hypothetical protein|tara:strand:+ start:610 stop:984 length:375 start_codon:yes stop_codon:yes gene_type:complete